ncbi:MAG: DUF2946 family protein [Reyranellaceae bacterium]
MGARTARRERLLATGLALTWLVVWLQVFLPFIAPADPLNPSRYRLGGDTVILCTVEGMKVVKLSDLQHQQQDGDGDLSAGMGSYACPRVATQTLAAAALAPQPVVFPAPRVFAVAWLPHTASRPRAPPPVAGFAARAPPFHA